MSPRQALNLGITFIATDRGIEVTGVLPMSPAQEIGLELGDVITTVHGYPAWSAEIWERLMSNQGFVRLGILDARTGKVKTIYVTLV